MESRSILSHALRIVFSTSAVFAHNRRMRPDGPDHFVMFSTGRRFYASAHTIGLGPDDHIGMRAFHGGIGMLDAGGPGEDISTWTPEEREELAAYMIERWRAFARPPFTVIERIDISNLTTM